MDRVQLLMVGLPLFLFCADLLNLFRPPPPKPHPHHNHHHPHHVYQPQAVRETLDVPIQKPSIEGSGAGNTVNINFCASCSYRGNAMTMKKMLETAFPAVDVVLSNYPPSMPKRLLSKVVPVFQVGVIGIITAGEHIFPMLGMVPPPWYYSLRANKFGTIASTWLVGNALQSFLQSSGAFEVYLNNDLVFSKLKDNRFPGEIELKDVIEKRLANKKSADGLEDVMTL